MKKLCSILTDLKNLNGDLHALVMLWSTNGWGRCSHALLHVLQSCILLLLLLPLTLLLLLQLVSHELDKHKIICHFNFDVQCCFSFFSDPVRGYKKLRPC